MESDFSETVVRSFPREAALGILLRRRDLPLRPSLLFLEPFPGGLAVEAEHKMWNILRPGGRSGWKLAVKMPPLELKDIFDEAFVSRYQERGSPVQVTGTARADVRVVLIP